MFKKTKTRNHRIIGCSEYEPALNLLFAERYNTK